MSRRQTEEDLRVSGRGLGILILIVLAIIVIAVIGFTTTYSVGVSQSAILVDPYSGSISGPVNGPITQFFAKAPWVNVVTFSTSVQTIQLQGNSTGVFVLSQDNLEIEFDVNFRYQLSASHLIDLYKKFPGQNWQSAAIEPHIRAAFRDVVAQYPADKIQIVRDQIQTGVEREIIGNIGNDTALASGVTVSSTQITDITLPTSFLNAIQNKLNAQQKLFQAQFEADQLIVTALGQRNATIIAAQAQANSTLIQATAQSQSIANIITQIEVSTCPTKASSCMWNSTQIATFTNLYTELKLLSNLTGQNLYIFLGSPTGNLIIPTKTGP